MIQRMLLTAETVHAVLAAECDQIVKSYRDDLLVHDLHHLKRCKDGTPFLHFSRETGTYMVMLIAADEYPAKDERVPYLFGTADREHCLDGVWDIVNFCTLDGKHVCNYYDGKTMRRVTANKARVIASEYADIIRKQWASGVSAPAPVGAYLGLGM